MCSHSQKYHRQVLIIIAQVLRRKSYVIDDDTPLIPPPLLTSPCHFLTKHQTMHMAGCDNDEPFKRSQSSVQKPKCYNVDTIQLMLFSQTKMTRFFLFFRSPFTILVHLNGSKKLQITNPISPFSARPTRIPSLSTPTSGYGKDGNSSIRPTS